MNRKYLSSQEFCQKQQCFCFEEPRQKQVDTLKNLLTDGSLSMPSLNTSVRHFLDTLKLKKVNGQNQPIGQSDSRSKYTDYEIELVRKLREDGLSYGIIAEKMDMPRPTVVAICQDRVRRL